MNESLFRRLMTVVRCEVCGEHYDGENVRVLGHYNDLWFLSVYCPGCHGQGLVAAVLKDGEPPGLVTDLAEEEYAEFRKTARVDADDVVDIQGFLKGFDGDFSRLFLKEEG